jgi:hypothetical protein
METIDQHILTYISHLNHYLWEHQLTQTLDYQIWFENGCLIVCVEHLALADKCAGLSQLLLGSNMGLKIMLKPNQNVIFELIT